MSTRKKIDYSALKRYAKMLGFGQIHYCANQSLGLEAIIAVHNTHRGPAIGGCRFYNYETHGHALKDVLRLAYGMSLKAAIVDLPHGGAKSVIIQPKTVKNRTELFEAFGDFVESLNGKYITAMDMGTTTQDMNVIATRTSHVIGKTTGPVPEGDPSPFTALGVFRSIQAAVAYKLKKNKMNGVKVAIQGMGKVGYLLAQHLLNAGAEVVACDTNPDSIERAKKDLNIATVPYEKIYEQECDVFSPCGIGGTLNHDSILALQCKIVAGCANNQLAHLKYGDHLHEDGILYCPDFLINSGGLIQAASIYDYHDLNTAKKMVDTLYDKTLHLLIQAEKQSLPTHIVAEKIAHQKLKERPVSHQEEPYEFP